MNEQRHKGKKTIIPNVTCQKRVGNKLKRNVVFMQLKLLPTSQDIMNGET